MNRKRTCSTCKWRNECGWYHVRSSGCSLYKHDHDAIMTIFGISMIAFTLGVLPYLIHLAKGGLP